MKKFIFLILDCLWVAVSLVASGLISGCSFAQLILPVNIYSFVILTVITVVVLYIFRVYNVLWRFARLNDYLRMAGSIFISLLAFFVVQNALSFKTYSLSDYFIIFVVQFILICETRIIYNHIRNQSKPGYGGLTGNIMVIGGGSAGCALINDISMSRKLSSCRVKCVIDDDPSKRGQYICGAKIVGGDSDIIPAAQQYKIDMIVLAIPSCSPERKKAILEICQKTGCQLRTIPSVYQLLSSAEINITTIRKVEIEDLLGRDPIQMNLNSVMNYVENKVVMVTGGGGSIGSELCRQIAVHKPKELIIFDIYENNAYDIQNELLKEHPELNLVTLIGSVRDRQRLEGIFEKHRPDIVYHAAAHKHVPLMEDSPNESIKNNVFGTENTAFCADKYGAEKFVLISTDKAVNPTNIMGASKRICEMIVQTYNKRSKTDFVAVRFGNVLGSNGSVIPLFKKQIEEGGPVTVTDPKIIRYFMTIPEAVSLVLQAGAAAQGGEIFVLDMGEPVKILDLAEKLIRLSGYQPYTDIRIEFTGLRPGEKLYEEMLMSEEGLKETENKLIHIGRPIDIDEELLEETLADMRAAMHEDSTDMRALVKRIVPGYSYIKN